MDKPLHEIYMHTSSGQPYYPFAPRPFDVEIGVVAHHLATRARWNGATQHPTKKTRIFYSVAEHSVYCSMVVEEILGRPELAMAALLHDAPEAYNGDLIRPLKYSPEFREPFKKVETINERAVVKHFQLGNLLDDPDVKRADEMVCHAEWLQIVPRAAHINWDAEWHDPAEAAPVQIAMLPPYEAKLAFLRRYEEIVERKRREVAA